MTTGQFNFMSADTPSSLRRNGRVRMDRDGDGNTAGTHGVDLTRVDMSVEDGRARALTCARNGFELLDAPLTAELDFLDHRSVVDRYYPECVALVEQATGAQAFAFDHNVRSAGGHRADTRIQGGQMVQQPAHVVHGDYTLTSAPERLRQLAQPPTGNDTLRGVLPDGEALVSGDDLGRVTSADGRFAIINVWRNIKEAPVQSHPLALCDAQTVTPEELVVFEIHYADRIGENYFSKSDERHRFYYFPEMTRDEALLIKQWDSAGRLATSEGTQGDAADDTCTFSFHSAFHDQEAPAAADDRWSIEVRCLVVY